MDPPIAIGGWAGSQELPDDLFELRAPEWSPSSRAPSVVQPTPGLAQDSADHGPRAARRACSPPYIPSGNLSPLSSKAFFNTSTSKALRPKARSSSSTRFCSPPTRLFGTNAPASLSPWSRLRFQRYICAAFTAYFRQISSKGTPVCHSCNTVNFCSPLHCRLRPRPFWVGFITVSI